MSKNLKFLSLVFMLLFAQNAFSVCSQTGNTVVFTGLDSGEGTIYADVREHNNQCSCNYVRFRPENTDTDKVLSILLAAKLSKNKVRIDFEAEGDCNSAERIYLQ